MLGGVASGQLTPDAVKVADGRLARISAQRRCASYIWNRISHLYPQVEYASNVDRLKTIAALPPVPGSSLAFVDLSNRGTKCEKMRNTWQNVGSAQVAMQVAATIASKAPQNYKIAIICPYRAHVKMLRQWIREEQKSEERPFGQANVETGTVHLFQGSDSDDVIFDLVDGPGRPNLGLLLRGDTGTRLLNVIISRARGKLVLIADKDWCRNASVSVNNKLLAQLVINGDLMKVVSPNELRRIKMNYLVTE